MPSRAETDNKGSARDLLTSEVFITSFWHADLPSFITLLINQYSRGEPATLSIYFSALYRVR